MPEAANKIKLGIFVFTGAVLYILGIYYIGKRQKMFGHTFSISAVFRDVKGLQVGNNVRLSGINVGIIEDIQQISDTMVKVDFAVEERVRKFIKKDSKATIGSDGLMGSKILLLGSGSHQGREIEDNDVLDSTVPVSVDDIIQKVKITSENAANITSDLSLIMDNISSGRGTVGMLFMDTVFSMHLYQSVVNIKRGSSAFEKNMDAAGKSFLLRRFIKNDEKTAEDQKEKEKKKEEKEESKKEKKARKKEEKEKKKKGSHPD